jgi:hypothetical protein
VLVRALRLLQAEHVGLERRHQVLQQRAAEPDGVDVPGGDAEGTFGCDACDGRRRGAVSGLQGRPLMMACRRSSASDPTAKFVPTWTGPMGGCRASSMGSDARKDRDSGPCKNFALYRTRTRGSGCEAATLTDGCR